MATPIRNIPTLFGKDAEVFLQAAERVEANPGTIDITAEAHALEKYLRKQNLW